MATAIAVPPPLQAQDHFFDDDVVINADLLCIGRDCFNGEAEIPNSKAGLKVNDGAPVVMFEDSSLPLGIPAHDWQIAVNAVSGPDLDNFQIEDLTAGTVPFNIKGLAPTDSLVIAPDGAVGFGTSLPQEELHVLDPILPALRLERLGSPTIFGERTWDIGSTVNGFEVIDRTSGVTPFRLREGAGAEALVVGPNSNVGLGTFVPQGKLHTRGNGTQLVYFESFDGGPVQVRMRSDSENRRFLAVNNANQVKSQIVFGDDQIQFLGASVAQEWLRISAAGIVSSGPTCNPNPCDATFDPEAFTVPPIEERAVYMWQNRHLPAVGPTGPDQPMNVTEKMGGVIHELEVAHIYIEQLDARMVRMQSEYEARIAELTARLESLEAR